MDGAFVFLHSVGFFPSFSKFHVSNTVVDIPQKQTTNKNTHRRECNNNNDGGGCLALSCPTNKQSSTWLLHSILIHCSCTLEAQYVQAKA